MQGSKKALLAHQRNNQVGLMVLYDRVAKLIFGFTLLEIAGTLITIYYGQQLLAGIFVIGTAIMAYISGCNWYAAQLSPTKIPNTKRKIE